MWLSSLVLTVGLAGAVRGASGPIVDEGEINSGMVQRGSRANDQAAFTEQFERLLAAFRQSEAGRGVSEADCPLLYNVQFSSQLAERLRRTLTVEEVFEAASSEASIRALPLFRRASHQVRALLAYPKGTNQHTRPKYLEWVRRLSLYANPNNWHHVLTFSDRFVAHRDRLPRIFSSEEVEDMRGQYFAYQRCQGASEETKMLLPVFNGQHKDFIQTLVELPPATEDTDSTSSLMVGEEDLQYLGIQELFREADRQDDSPAENASDSVDRSSAESGNYSPAPLAEQPPTNTVERADNPFLISFDSSSSGSSSGSSHDGEEAFGDPEPPAQEAIVPLTDGEDDRDLKDFVDTDGTGGYTASTSFVDSEDDEWRGDAASNEADNHQDEPEVPEEVGKDEVENDISASLTSPKRQADLGELCGLVENASANSDHSEQPEGSDTWVRQSKRRVIVKHRGKRFRVTVKVEQQRGDSVTRKAAKQSPVGIKIHFRADRS